VAAPTIAASEHAASIIEDTVILFANGQVEQALATLSRAVRDEDLGGLALQGWLMLLDLYQHLGMAAEFEVLALRFSVRFERSPPTWLEAREHRDAALDPMDIGSFALSGVLSKASAPELEKLMSTAAARHAVRVECGKLEGLDGPGCGLLGDAFLSLRGSGKKVLLSEEAQILRLLEHVCRPKRIETDRAVWALLFEIYRILDFKDKFEEAAVDYAVTFEVSPPSWESKPTAEAKRAVFARPIEAADAALAFSRELTGASDALAKQLRDWAAANNMLVIDISQVRRVDFVTAGLIFKVLSKLRKDGTTIQIRGASELIHALFRIMGIDKVARIIPRK
jgi:anti-anti-sigma regulatory factor